MYYVFEITVDQWRWNRSSPEKNRCTGYCRDKYFWKPK